MNRIKVLVFPCGSEVGLEIYQSLQYSRHIEVIGGNSVDDHGKFVYDKYIGDIPFVNDIDFINGLKEIIVNNKIDAIYPAMDNVLMELKKEEKNLNCKIISSPLESTILCSSKKATYKELENFISVPFQFASIDDIEDYPVFIKPNKGHGSRGAKKISNKKEALNHLDDLGDNYVITEYLPGIEYTVDCFTNKEKQLLFIGPRPRKRIRTGISVNSISIEKKERLEFERIANIINERIEFRGAWFFQLKRNHFNELVLMEVASRMGGSSSLYRFKGINFALLSIFDAFNYDVSIIENDPTIEIDRALDVKVKIDYYFNKVYVDFDDCLIINNKVNVKLVSKLFYYLNLNKKIFLITRHASDINITLKKYRISNVFDEIIHLKDNKEKKSSYIDGDKAIFIDDSYIERLDVHKTHGIPVFSPDMIC